MAGGKLTPRQKMINLMYLVFIAMLALNMSKEVLSAFGILNSKIVESNQLTTARNNDAFTQLAQKATEQPGQFADKKVKVEKIRALSNDFYNYIEELKKKSSAKFDMNEEGVYEKMDKGEYFDELFFKGDKISPEGKAFVDRINNYAAQIKQIGGSAIAADEMKKIENRFTTAPVKSKSAGATVDWLEYNYHGFPLIASITKLSQLQADIKTTESDIIAGMFQTSLISAASLTKYQPIVVPEKSAFFQGETVKGKIILGKFDPELVARAVTVNGQSVKATAGEATFAFTAGNVGEHDITGSFDFDEGGKVVKLPIKGNYVVVPKPNSATISADKMNSVYRGVTNPMTVSFAGISDDKVTVSAPGLTKGSKPGQYNWNVTGLSGKTAMVTVTGKLPDGKSVSDKKTFNIREIPRPAPTLRGMSTSGKGNKNDLASSTVKVEFPDFVFDVQTTVQSFELYVPGNAAIVVTGDRFNDAAKKAIAKATRGDVITIMNIKTKLVGAPGYNMRGSSSFTWEVQ